MHLVLKRNPRNYASNWSEFMVTILRETKTQWVVQYLGEEKRVNKNTRKIVKGDSRDTWHTVEEFLEDTMRVSR